ncbi:hypothetical protein PPTG_19928, partial [Phytophthora nicotianae INRA-310]
MLRHSNHIFRSALVDLTSSPCSSPRSAARRSPATVSTVELADPLLDLAGVRASLSALQQAIDQIEALRDLRSDLRREFLATRCRAEDLDRQFADAANAASPYVLFCQHKYEVVNHQLNSTREKLAECLNALQERMDNSREFEGWRLRYHDLQLRYNEA